MDAFVREKCIATDNKPRTERISMSLQKAYQTAIIDGVFEAKRNPSHELSILAGKIDYERLCEKLKPNYSNIGRNGKPIGLMVGAHILRRMFSMKVQEQIRIGAELLKRIINQTEARYARAHLKNKVYSLHEP